MYMWVCTCGCVCICVCVCTCTLLHVCVCMCMLANMCVCASEYIIYLKTCPHRTSQRCVAGVITIKIKHMKFLLDHLVSDMFTLVCDMVNCSYVCYI